MLETDSFEPGGPAEPCQGCPHEVVCFAQPESSRQMESPSGTDALGSM